MTLSLLFWVLMLLWIVLGMWSSWSTIKSDWRPAGGQILLFILLLVLGWAQFGAPVQS